MPAKVLKAVAEGAGSGDEKADPSPQEAEARSQAACKGAKDQGFVMPCLADMEQKGQGLKSFLEDIETVLIEEALNLENGSQQKAALRLGIKRTTLIEKMKRKGLL